MELIIGTKAWSSWSMRPWLALKRTGAPFTETLITLRQEQATADAIAAAGSQTGQIPVLKDGDLQIHDSLAICEYLAERYPDARLWPADPAARALGRSAAAEMHAGFGPLRKYLPMALNETLEAEITEEVAPNIRRIVDLWSGLLSRFGGPYLLGESWSIADAYYTPVATRFRTYRVALAEYGDDGAAAACMNCLLAEPHFLEWEAAAAG
jgi:glutathione S-transferase